MEGIFPDRVEAGRLLGVKLSKYAGRDDVIVLGLPRGGVPVAYEVARALRQRGAARIVVAVPVGPPDTCREFEDEADEVICASAPEFFQAVGQYYEDFSQTSDEEVRELLSRAAESEDRPASA